MDDIATWEAAGGRIPTDHGQVWYTDLPATGPDPEGPPVLVVHGFPTSSFDWRHVLPRLRERHRVVLCDLPGFGLSDKPDRRYSLRLYADAVEAVARHAALDEVALVTHDMGDSVGGELLARAGEGTLPFTVVRRLLTNGSIYIEMAQLTDGQQALLGLPDERFDLAAVGIDPGTGYRGGLAGIFSPAHPASDDELDAQWALMSRLDGHQLLPRTIRYIEDRRAEEARFTGAIETHPSPLGVIWGAADPVAVVPMTDRLRAARPDIELVILDDVGHFPMVEDPQRFAEAAVQML